MHEHTCPCGRTTRNARSFIHASQQGRCIYCNNSIVTTNLLNAGVIESVTQRAQLRAILHNLELRARDNRVCVWCGVTLSGRSHARTCSAKCRKSLSRSGIQTDNWRPELMNSVRIWKGDQ